MDALTAVANETLKIVDEGGYGGVDLRESIEEAVAGTRVLREQELEELVLWKQPAAEPRARIHCREERSGACVKRLLDGGARRVAVLNYANGVRPGGGFLHGARAQEEALCRCSALYACLTSNAAGPFFDDNLATQSALVTGDVIVSPDVPFFRNEALELLEEPFCATVLTAAAPDLGWLRAATMEGSEPKSRFDEVPGIFARRTLFVMAAAVHAGCDAIVAGPWGCGAFGNDPEVVAEAFKSAVARYGDAFSDIVFSTWGPVQNREAFERRFKSATP